MTSTPESALPSRALRRGLLLALTCVVVAGLVGSLAYDRFYGNLYESTEDAYANGNLVQLMPQISGAVLTIHADDTDFVQAGQTLVELDRADREIALEEAEAELGQAVREVRALFARKDQLAAELAVREAELAKARSDVARREGLTARGLVPREELDHARDALNAAQASLRAAQESLAATRVRVDGASIDNHPEVARAAAHVKHAWVALRRTTIRAPVTGYVARRTVQVGQRVEPGMSLLSIVPLEDLWVDANFKEVQLGRMRIGQPAKVTADLYGGRVEYDGEIAGVGMGTGAAFALLPAQNASGNWIKIVQRVPVRIRLRPEQLRAHPLRIGLSMRVSVDLRQDGLQLAQAPRAQPAYATQAPLDAAQAEARIRDIVAANGGRARPEESSVARVGAP
jgi:membrane fusion protein, multidrug efflux system